MKELEAIRVKPFDFSLVLEDGKLLPKYEIINTDGQLVATAADFEIALRIRRFYNDSLQIKNKATNQFIKFK